MVHSPNRKYIDKIIEESRRMMGVMIERYSCRTLAVSYIRKHCGAGTGISYWAVGISSASSVVSHGSGTYIARNPIRLTLPSPRPGQHQGCRVPGKTDHGYDVWGSRRPLESIATQAPKDLMLFRTILPVPK